MLGSQEDLRVRLYCRDVFGSKIQLGRKITGTTSSCLITIPDFQLRRVHVFQLCLSSRAYPVPVARLGTSPGQLSFIKNTATYRITFRASK